MLLEFAVKTKGKNCRKGYPCGGGCINRQKSCNKQLDGQGSNYANWLKKSQPENLPAKGGALALASGSKKGDLAIVSKSSKSDNPPPERTTPFALPPGKEQKARAKGFTRTDPSNFDNKGKYTASAKVTELIEKSAVTVPVSRKDKDAILKTPESARKYLTDAYSKNYDNSPQWLRDKEGKKLDLSDDRDLDIFYERKIGEVPKPKKTGTSVKKRKTTINSSQVNGVNLTNESNAKKASPWTVFGLNKSSATKAQVKKAFGDLALKHHPDQGGDPRTMRTLIALKDRALANFGEAPGDWDWYASFQEDLELIDIFNA